MKLKGINHITFSVSDLEKSIEFYKNVFGADLLVKGERVGDRLAYFDLNGLWLALNVEDDVSRNEIYESYTHISFSIDEEDYVTTLERLKQLDIDLKEGRPRFEEEGKSIYFRDPDGHLFEFHTKTREDRIKFYKKNRPSLTFFE
ncbi:metallothiol transferase FosB [Wukongibacter sp. M2B1]|uniref:metallothiol transferase FosB n=1 Tax=Wukongibacter sp. M2B1 TaxID=3088895 RepID=UPI003D79BCA0